MNLEAKSYSPMLAKETTLEEAKLLIKKGWIVEEKKDGVRILLFYENGNILIAEEQTRAFLKIQNRRGDDITNTYPEIHSIKLNCKSAVLDCEFVAISGNFQDIQKRSHLIKKTDIELRMKKYPVIAVCFDLLYCDGNDLTNKPLIERQEKLAEIIDGHSENLIQISSVNPSEKEFMEIWESVKKEGLEGLMLKDGKSVYENGVRSNSWLKLKYVKSCDCPILRFEESVGAKGNKGLTLICKYNKNEIRVACNGLADRERVKNHNSKKPLIAEVRYLNQTDSGVLRQPTLKAIKDE